MFRSKRDLGAARVLKFSERAPSQVLVRGLGNLGKHC